MKTRLLMQLAAGIFLLSPVSMMSQKPGRSQCSAEGAEISASALQHEIKLDAQHPSLEWQSATPIRFCWDWQGKNADPQRETQVRALWSPQTLYLRFECHYRDITVFPDSQSDGRRDHLWDRDVAEAFLQPDPSRERYYKEFEVSPNGLWIDLNITPGPLEDLKSGMQRSVWLDEASHTWTAELAIPMKSLTSQFDSANVWRVNFYRVEGKQEPRFYSAWQPTKTPKPNFHVPRAFGRMRFAPVK
ncbi:MAG TPA: carbohydrate-binding family 9-like protein [Terriglobales bacterium]|nr:carbohydrate-binding family 9-like protein [Terriglobales bacterium]